MWKVKVGLSIDCEYNIAVLELGNHDVWFKIIHRNFMMSLFHVSTYSWYKLRHIIHSIVRTGQVGSLARDKYHHPAE